MIRLCALITLGALVLPGLGLAQTGPRPEEGRKIVPAGQRISEDYGVAGEVVEISGVIDGDAYVVGGQIFVNGVIEGDLLAVGGTVNVSGEVKQNVRVLGGQVIISGHVGRNVTVAGMNVTLTDSASVQGGVVLGGSTVFLSAPVGKEARVAGRNLTVSSAIGGDLEAAVESARLTSGAQVGGDFTYWSNREASIDSGASIAGAVTKKSPDQLLGGAGRQVGSLQHFMKPYLGAVSFFTTFVLGLLLLYFFPGYTTATMETLRHQRWRSFTNGVTALLLIPLLFGLLIITIVGIPLGFLLLLLSSLILYMARIFAMLVIGELILERFGKSPQRVLALLVGLVVYSVIVLAPVVGWAVSFFAALFGLGAAVQTAKDIIGQRTNKNSSSS